MFTGGDALCLFLLCRFSPIFHLLILVHEVSLFFVVHFSFDLNLATWLRFRSLEHSWPSPIFSFLNRAFLYLEAFILTYGQEMHQTFTSLWFWWSKYSLYTTNIMCIDNRDVNGFGACMVLAPNTRHGNFFAGDSKGNGRQQVFCSVNRLFWIVSVPGLEFHSGSRQVGIYHTNQVRTSARWQSLSPALMQLKVPVQFILLHHLHLLHPSVI